MNKQQIQEKLLGLYAAATPLHVVVALLALVAVYIAVRCKRNSKLIRAATQRNSKLQLGVADARSKNDVYDVVVVGGSISGTVASIRFARQGRKVLVVEKDLARPDTIIGELLQPGGVEILRRMGLEHCALDVGVPAHGYVAAMDGRWIDLPFDQGAKGVSFHHGDFVMQLRRAMLSANESDAEVKKTGGRITVVEGLVDKYLYAEDDANTVCGIRYRARINSTMAPTTAAAPATNGNGKNGNGHHGTSGKKGDAAVPSQLAVTPEFDSKATEVTSGLVVCCDGNASLLRPPPGPPRTPHSHFVGMVLRNCTLRSEQRGNVILGRKGIVLAYRLDAGEVRLLIDWGRPGPLPSQRDVIAWLRNDMKPELPSEEMRAAFEQELQRAEAGEADAVRARPHLHFTPMHPALRGCVGIGDHGNMRHPLTGAGMTCAMRDAFYLTEAISAAVPVARGSYGAPENRAKLQAAIRSYLLGRHSHSAVMNVLSWALYGVFTGPMSIRHAVMSYFDEGGDAVAVPLRMLAGLESSFGVLLWHYIRTMLTGAKFHIAGPRGQRSVVKALTFFVNPLRIAEALYLLVYATCLFAHCSWVEFVTFWRLVDRSSFPLAL